MARFSGATSGGMATLSGATPQQASRAPKSLPTSLYGGDPQYNNNGGAVDQNQLHAEIGADSNDNAPGPDRTQYGTLAPPGMESRIMLADRVNDFFTPGVSYAEQDGQKGGAPGSPGSAPGGNDPNSKTSFITSQSPAGVDTPGGAPVSQLKLSYGASDWASPQPTALPAHLKIAIAQNPNAAQRNPGIWSAEGPMANTKYESPAPWAQGSFIG